MMLSYVVDVLAYYVLLFVIDQNECVSNTNLCSEVCINVVGGYMCSCLPGMRTDPMNPAHCIGK